jgi:hypothetical protein
LAQTSDTKPVCRPAHLIRSGRGPERTEKRHRYFRAAQRTLPSLRAPVAHVGPADDRSPFPHIEAKGNGTVLRQTSLAADRQFAEKRPESSPTACRLDPSESLIGQPSIIVPALTQALVGRHGFRDQRPNGDWPDHPGDRAGRGATGVEASAGPADRRSPGYKRPDVPIDQPVNPHAHEVAGRFRGVRGFWPTGGWYAEWAAGRT